MAYRTSAGVNDLVLLDTLSNDGIFDCLASHYKKDEIYTYIGNVLISVNPFKDISGLYSAGTLKKYPHKQLHVNSPHIFAIAERAYRSMAQNLTKECVIISGESGAGKTEAAKKVMEYVSAMSSKSKEVQKVKDQLLQTNPLLEAFGNAKTVRNNNSSRFGKYMDMRFNLGDPRGGLITVYLLEKNRVVQQQKEERNFHVFYQMAAGGSSGDKKKWAVNDPGKFKFLSASGCVKVSGINDANDYGEMRRAMDVVGLSGGQQGEVFELLAAILHLGELTFAKSENGQGSVLSGGDAALVAKLLQVGEADLRQALTNKTITSRGDAILTPLNVAAAADARDSLAKSLYGRIFDFLVKTINETISTTGHSTSIGVLDIYGFEIFQDNGFPQLCINYVNEKLHQLFIELTLKAEQEEYAREGIEWQKIDYYNNLPIVELVEKRGGLFALLDEECVFPNGSDKSFYEKVKQNLDRHKEFSMVPSGARTQFAIEHYAGKVAYETTGMLAKNKDLLFIDLIKLVAGSGNSVGQEMFAADAASDSKKRPLTTCVQFKKQVADLMASLKECNQNYVRTIKPNDQKRGGVVEKEMMMNQIKYLGLLENVKVRRAGYSFRLLFDRFNAKYKAIGKGHPVWEGDAESACMALVKGLGLDKDVKFGKTKIFIKSPKSVFALEDKRNKFLSDCAEMVLKGSKDSIIFADKVHSFDKKFKKSPHVLVICDQGVWVMNPKDKKPIHRVPMELFNGITLPSEDGWMVLHMTVNAKKSGEGQSFDYLVENVYKSEIESVLEVLKVCRADMDVAYSSTIPLSASDPQEAARQAKEAQKADKKGCTIL